MNIAAQIAALREGGGLTLVQVANACGLSVSYLSDLERGRTEPSLEALRAIAAAYGLELHIMLVEKSPDVVHVPRRTYQRLVNQVLDVARELEAWKEESEE